MLLISIAGQHGWDNKEALMHPIFIARGPAFKKNYVADPFETINMYALQCCLLGINPRPNNGSLDAVRHILKTSVSVKKQCFRLFIVLYCVRKKTQFYFIIHSFNH